MLIRKSVITVGSAIAVALFVAGCSTSAELDPFGKKPSESERTQLAAYAASADYPRDATASDDLRVAAVINRKNDTIRVFNFSDRPIQDANVWVNGAFVRKVPVIPPNGSVTLDRSTFYDATGRSLSGQSASANKVEIGWGDDLYRAQGPVYE